ncbi:hypothetical protein [Curtobacterium sp. ISL-83]|uniref:hypothetical protein n=1 Tax=Curtobacterium sp. ISL-83 TaxID=2819145 RepID=UPI001BEB0599|nr:hypothetical protein [Curtobacterium sp. ISL-83]MBT2503738.1 hypothetical protein [Curtobacterium sp. ISL-83]
MHPRRPRPLTTTTVLLAAALALTGCSSLAANPNDPVAAARGLSDAPTWVAHRTGHDCGGAELSQSKPLSAKTTACVTAAQQSSDVATLAWVTRTTEGDPTPTFARITTRGTTVSTTAAFDQYGGGGWSTSTCADFRDLPNGPSCGDAG